MPGGVFKDIAGNNYAGITDATTWNFTIGLIPDNTAPNAVSFTPADDATNVARNTDLVITFNEPVQKGTGSITITQNGTEQIIAVASPAVTISGNTATINPAVDFKAGSQIHVMMPPGVFADLANNAYAGINQPTTWNFTTAGILDEIAPDIVSFSPADNAVDVAVNANLVITFNEDIKAGTGNIIINFENTTQTIEILSPAVTIAGKTLTIDPETDFLSGAAINVLMLPGTVTDLADNPFGGIISADTWNFSVIDNIPPTVSSFFPADNATDVARNTDLIITFSEAIKKGTGNIQISQNGEIENIPVTDPRITVSGSTATITPTIDFKSGAQVYILAPSGIFTDLADNAYTGINEPATWNFTIAGSSDELAPEVISLSPPDNSTNVAVEANLVVTFNEDIKAGAGNIIIAKGGTAQTIDVTSSAVTIAGKTLTIDPETDFPSGEAVSVLILPGAVTDIAGNAFKGITDASTWNFTIIDNIPPVISSFFPADNATSIAANINLVMIFSEAC
jgi:methionine-rich copper-binding protein CopC